METFLQQVINGISQGSAYALIALGYTMVYGVLRLINFAHSSVYMVGAFAGFYIANSRFVQASLGTSVLAAVLVMVGAMAVCALVGMLIERFAYRPGRGPVSGVLAFWLGLLGAGFGFQVDRAFLPVAAGALIGALIGAALEKFGRVTPAPESSTLKVLIIAIGVSLILENGGQIVFGADPKFFPPVIPNRALDVGGLTIDSPRLVVLGVALLLMVLLNLIVLHTKTGKAMRAVSFNLDAARLMGINTDRIIAFTFALGSALAGAGGILVSLMYPRIDPLMGTVPGLKAFVAAVLGGIGNITGAMIGGLIIGLAEVMAVGYGSSTYRDAIAFVILVLILLIKPTGIMGKGMVEKV
ncbi:MAG: branched-chain amino acid ABC transporter permease [Gemmatimonadota bacterium]|jgi:branched-chain amino acid transport system permease protein|nr:branched-chain amino acid ABC transporter permease [Gemmatimonadota bacterium]